jgi:hypothetical protein
MPVGHKEVAKMKMRKIAGLLAALALAGLAHAQETVKVKSGQKVLVAPKAEGDGVGRYVLGQISDFRADQYLLDTKTGRIWQVKLDAKLGEVLVPVGFVGTDGQLMGWEPLPK